MGTGSLVTRCAVGAVRCCHSNVLCICATSWDWWWRHRDLPFHHIRRLLWHRSCAICYFAVACTPAVRYVYLLCKGGDGKNIWYICTCIRIMVYICGHIILKITVYSIIYTVLNASSIYYYLLHVRYARLFALPVFKQAITRHTISWHISWLTIIL